MEYLNQLTPISSDWYKLLIDDCQGIVTEAEFNSRDFLIRGYHELGRRILEDAEKFGEFGMKKEDAIKIIATDIGRSTRTVERAVQFYQKFPELEALPEGKSISWHKIVNVYLPEKSQNVTSDGASEKDTLVCPGCGLHFHL